MLVEIKKKHDADQGVRRWFSDENEALDLACWYDQDNQITGFQLSYVRKNIAKAFTWTEKNGYAHYLVDEGDKLAGFYKETPVLIPDENFSPADLARSILSESKELEADIFNFVMCRLFLYALELSPDPMS